MLYCSWLGARIVAIAFMPSGLWFSHPALHSMHAVHGTASFGRPMRRDEWNGTEICWFKVDAIANYSLEMHSDVNVPRRVEECKMLPM